MANTFTKIASVTVGSGGTSSIDFTSIPATYTDLKILHSLRSANSQWAGDISITLNSSTSNFTMRRLFSDNTNYSDTGGGNYNWVGQNPGASPTASTFGNGEIYIPNYAGSNYKPISGDSVTETNGSTYAYRFLGTVLWSNTAAITSISLTSNGGNWIQYSIAVLYGIKNS